MLNARNISVVAMPPARCSHRKSGGTVQLSRSSEKPQPVGKHARQVLGDATAGDVGHALDPAALEQRRDDRQIRPMRAQQRRPDRLAELRHVAVDARARARRTRSRRASEYPFVWSPDDGSAISTSPAAMPRPSMIRARDTRPTMKPATSYSPSA